ncbi:unnamed protein product, partial [Ectocarpus sp. 6 AP-2014]
EGVWKQIKELAQGSSCEKHAKGYMYELSSKETDLGRTRVDDHVLDAVQPVLD